MNAIFSQMHRHGASSFGTPDDFLFLRQPNGRYAIGKGPFTLLKDPHPASPTFYFNDFSHSCSHPWITPRHYCETTDVADLINAPLTLPIIAWQSPSKDIFQRAFDTIEHYISSGILNKIVPVIVEDGHLLTGRPEALARTLESMPKHYYPYGIRIGNGGMIGASPEPIASINKNRLTTMALAGTAASNDTSQRLLRSKECREHGYVADFIASRLQPYGRTHRSSIAELDLGSVRHLMTTFETQLTSPPDIAQLVSALHPTPAVGPMPCSPDNLQLAVALRNIAGVPHSFGAPFGIACGNHFHAVLTIRNLLWKANRIMLPSGCGIVQGSNFEEEWEELRLKRESVKAFLNVGNSHSTPQALSA